MNLRSVQLQRFRRFDERSIAFDPRVTLVTGRNGNGKTTVLDAVAVALGAYVEALGVPSRGLVPGDLRRGSPPDEEGEAPRPSITCRIRMDGEDRQWTRTGAADDLAPSALLGGDGDTLPVFAYYGGVPRPFAQADPASPRLAAHAGCFEIGEPEAWAVSWLSTLADGAAVGEARPFSLVAVENALTMAIGDSDPVVVSVADGALHLAVGGAAPVPFAELGGGVRRIASMVADLVLRCCTANPHLGGAAPLSTPGVVLVERLEAGLHPRWQRYLLDDLRSLFPAIQIIATTESPLLLQALHAGDYVDLDGRRPADVARMSLEDITEDVLGVKMPQRSKRFHDMQKAAAEVLALVRQGDSADPQEKEVLKARLDEKMMPFSNEPAWTAVLRMERVAAGLADAGADEEEEEDR